MQHLAIIPDGNRRWAVKNKLQTFFGHRKGVTAIRSAIEVCLKNKIKHLSIYTFSLENFRRSEQEKTYLFNILAQECKSELPKMQEQGIRVKFIGDKILFPENIQAMISEVEAATQDNTALNVNFLFCYGAKQEIVYAARSLARRVKSGEIKPEEIDESMITGSLWTAGTPDPDLIIRTGGAIRLSNFLLFQAAYSEFKFVDNLWPEMTTDKIQLCVDEFEDIKRNFGN